MNKAQTALEISAPKEYEDDDTTISTDIGRVSVLVIASAILFVMACVLWAGLAQISGGAATSGVLKHVGQRTTIQHLEGGIVQKVMVSNGEIVEAGQPLLTFAKAEYRAELRAFLERRVSLEARLARLQAEQKGQKEIDFPNWISKETPSHQRAIRDQLILHATRIAARDNRQNILKKQIDQLSAELAGMKAQLISQKNELHYLKKDISSIETLVKQGHARISQLRNLKRQQVVLEGENAQSKASIARIQKEQSEIELQLVQLDIDLFAEIARDIERTRSGLTELQREIAASSEIVKRTVVFAPVSGEILAENLPTVGSVIRSAEKLFDIVPTDRSMIVQSRLSPNDVEGIAPGSRTLLRFTGVAHHDDSNFQGMVRRISSDTLIDPSSGAPYYNLEIVVDRSELVRLQQNANTAKGLVAGMPVDILVVKESRTLLSYLTAPLMKSSWRAFRE